MKTEIINKTNQSFELKEGNAGAYRLLKQLDPGAKHSIKVDPNATYREYMVATGKKGETIFLTSDDFSEFKVIDIEEGPGENPGTVIYKSMTRNPRKPGLSKAPKPSNVGGAGCKSKAEGGSNAGVGSDPPAPSAPGVGSDPPAPSAAGVGPDPPAPSAAAVESVPTASSAAGVGSDPPVSSAAAVGSNPPAPSAAGVGPVPAASSAAAVGSVPTASSPAGVGSVAPASSTASSKPSKNERVPWYRKPKSWFK